MVEIVKYAATGRRKCSIARVNLIPGNGTVTVNNRPLENYFPREAHRITILVPLKKLNLETKFDVIAKVEGGGVTGQAGAIQLGLSRALIACEPDNRSVLRKASLLTRDPRMKERKKPGQKGARRKFQWVKR
ncbi:MAG: 30S ribosomal protein S9 [Omnitrophica WOR_2 bacterium GWA2_47_8]|nr:MAG: 30S ribosomal protein S9 [Omnitrophica WOR_2 bacterium GWA2_47_8]